MRKYYLFAAAFVVIGLLVGALVLGLDKEDSEQNQAVATDDIKQLVHDYSIGKLKAESASITTRQLIVTNAESEKITYDLPEEEFFVSIAPYIEETHPCATHSLTGCRGELADKEFSVSIKDQDGNVILEQTMKSQANGFIDLWLPRNQTYAATITYDGKTSVSEISTTDDSNTCVATMQLI